MVIFVHFVARSFCVKIKFPKEMPKITKCLKCLKLRYSTRREPPVESLWVERSILLKEKSKVCDYIHLLISGFHAENTRRFRHFSSL